MKNVFALALMSLFVIPFTIDVLNATNFSDVDMIQRGLDKSDTVEHIAISRTGKGFTRFSGTAKDGADDFLSDLKGLAQDRFTVETIERPDGSLAITLRKISIR